MWPRPGTSQASATAITACAAGSGRAASVSWEGGGAGGASGLAVSANRFLLVLVSDVFAYERARTLALASTAGGARTLRGQPYRRRCCHEPGVRGPRHPQSLHRGLVEGQ